LIGERVRAVGVAGGPFLRLTAFRRDRHGVNRAVAGVKTRLRRRKLFSDGRTQAPRWNTTMPLKAL
jgi:hypothetical protein